MKFVGIAKDRKVFVIAGKRDVRELGDYDWGANPPTTEMRNLARRMLIEATGDTVLATRLYMRFMYHTLAGLKPDGDWQMDGQQVLTVVNMLKEADREIAQIRQMAGREFPRIQPAGPQFPGASGYGGNDSAPDRKRG